MSWVAAAATVGAGLLGANAAKKAGDQQENATRAAIDAEVNQNIQNRADLAPYRELGKSATKRLGELLGFERSREDYVLPNGQTLKEAVAREYENQVRLNMGKQGNSAYERPFEERTDSMQRTILDRYLPGVMQKYGITEEMLAAQPSGPSPEEIMKMDPGYQFRLAEGEKALDRRVGAMGLRNSGAALKGAIRYGQDYATNAFDSIYNRLAGAAGTGQTATTNTAGLNAQSAGTVGNLMTAGANARGASAIARGNALAGIGTTIGNYYSQQETLDKILGRGGVSSRPSNADLAREYNF